MELVEAAVKFVGAGFDLDVDGGAAGHPLLGVKTVGDDVDRLDRVLGRHVGDDMREPRIAHRRAVEPRVVVGEGGSVEVGDEGPLRVAGVRVGIGRRRSARDQLVELLEVAAGADRQVADLGLVDLVADVGAIRLQDWRGGGDRHALGRASNLESDIFPNGRIEADGDTGLGVGLESILCDLNVVGADLQIAEREGSGFVGDRLA